MDESLLPFTLHLADNSLILGQRNAEWCGHGPILEQDIAITNISLDLIGQARYLYQYAASLINLSAGQCDNPSTEDSLAFLRTDREYKNLLLVEQPNGDWGKTILRQFLFSAYQYILFEKLQNNADEPLASIAEKSLKETTYHLRWSSEWVIRLGDGTEESHLRMLRAVEELWPYTGEMFVPAPYETKIGIDFSFLKNEWLKSINKVFAEATLPLPPDVYMQTGGKLGMHTEHLGYILVEMQYMQRAYPNAEW